jgi:dihydroorotate dehydrogenase electron transfer subunit
MKNTMKSVWSGKIIFNRKLRPLHFHLGLSLPEAFADPYPGQFVMLRSVQQGGPLLSRPFSIYHFVRGQDRVRIEILYRVTGAGTEMMSALRGGMTVTILGPLGKGFVIDGKKKNHLLVAGGMGMAPISFLAGYLHREGNAGNRVITCLGARHCGDLLRLEQFEKLSDILNIATEDGTMGSCGMVTDFLPEMMKEYNPAETNVYACGPMPMLKSLAGWLATVQKLSCQVSVEERMACGVGACLGCAVPLFDARGRITQKSVCKYGPVFDSSKICWEQL